MVLWISDSGTDRVYRYADGRPLAAPALTSSFALAAGNTNSQGLADPPPAAVESQLPGYQAEQSVTAETAGFPTVIDRRGMLPATVSGDQSGLTTLVSPVVRRSATSALKKTVTGVEQAADTAGRSSAVSGAVQAEPAAGTQSGELLDDVFGQLASSGLSWLN